MTTKNFEALIYTPSRTIAAICAVALSDLPIDWMLADTPKLANRYLSQDKFDFVLIDFESDDAEDILLASAATQSLVLVMTSSPVEARVLALSHEHRFYYPVRLAEVPALMQSLATLAEHLSTVRPTEALKPSPVTPAAPAVGRLHSALKRATSKKERLASLEPESKSDLLPKELSMRHTFSIEAHERIASMLAAAGSIWYVNQVTSDFRGLEVLGPPAPGPVELIVVALLLWICAKHRRILPEQQPAHAISAS